MIRIGRTRRSLLVAAGLALTMPLALGAGMSTAASAGPQQHPVRTAGSDAAAAPLVIPKPVSMQTDPGQSFTVRSGTRIVVQPGAQAATDVGALLAETLRRSTGFALPIDTRNNGGTGNNISLRLSGPAKLGAEGYRLDATHGGVQLSAPTAAGLFHGVQTLLQLLPPRVESTTVQPGPWTVPGVHIVDYPRFAWRGAMLDVSRHFFTVEEVKHYIDEIAMYKINVLHLHLSDDQGWRIAINSWPRLATIGGSTEVGGGTGGSYTQAQYKDIVAYAAEHFITTVPEIDTPGHTNAALASYAALNCNNTAPPLYTGTDVGFSSLCVDKDITYKFLDDVIGELAALTPGPYIHIGGDEAHSTPLSDYTRFIDRLQPIVHAHGKNMMGWNEIAQTHVQPGPATLAQNWSLADDTHPIYDRLATAAVSKAVKLVMSPANKAYLDMQYNPTSPYGQNWAGYVSVQDSYHWDPATIFTGVTESDIKGVEAPLWSETLTNIHEIEYMAFPRLPGIAEIGWSSSQGRSWSEYRMRLGAQGPRWDVMGTNYYHAPEVPWADASTAQKAQ